MLEAAIKLDKHRAEPHIELARIYIAKGERGLAVAAAKKATKLAPLSSQAWNTAGRAELTAFNYDAAIEAFSKSVELDATNIWAWNNLGLAELQLKKYDEAAEHFAEATSRKGATGFMYNNLGTALEQLGQARRGAPRVRVWRQARLAGSVVESQAARGRQEHRERVARTDQEARREVVRDERRHAGRAGDGRQ